MSHDSSGKSKLDDSFRRPHDSFHRRSRCISPAKPSASAAFWASLPKRARYPSQWKNIFRPSAPTALTFNEYRKVHASLQRRNKSGARALIGKFPVKDS
jgi:hypothetical protein